MKIILYTQELSIYITQAAQILADAFPHAYANYENQSMQEIQEILAKDGFLIFALKSGELLGFAGAIPQYGTTGWELHPLVVKRQFRLQGIGTKLVSALENEIVSRAGIMVYLGTDDEFFATSLSHGDLFDNTFKKIQEIKNFKDHPYEFYSKTGYQIVGVIPDANGFNKPDILMAKRLVPFQ